MYQEINQILKSKKPSKTFNEWDRTGKLQEVLPEVADLKGVKQDKKWHPEGDVYNHTMRAVDFYEGDIVGRWAVLLHDLGKKTTHKKSHGSHKFPEHARDSVKMARKAMNRLNVPQSIAKRVLWLIGVHNDYYKILEYDVDEIKKLVKHPDFGLYVRVAYADEGSRGREPKSWIESVKRMKALVEFDKLPEEAIEDADKIKLVKTLLLRDGEGSVMTNQEAAIKGAEMLKLTLQEIMVKATMPGRVEHMKRKLHEAKRNPAMERSIHSVDDKLDETAARMAADAESTGITSAGRGLSSGKKPNPTPTPTSTKVAAAHQAKQPISTGDADMVLRNKQSTLETPASAKDAINMWGGDKRTQRTLQRNLDPFEEDDNGDKDGDRDTVNEALRRNSKDVPTNEPTDSEGKVILPIEKVEDGDLGQLKNDKVAYRGPTTETEKMKKDKEKKAQEAAEAAQQQAPPPGAAPPGAVPPGAEGMAPAPAGAMPPGGAPPPGMEQQQPPPPPMPVQKSLMLGAMWSNLVLANKTLLELSNM